MANKKTNIVTIDLDKWCTMAEKARLLGLNESTIRQRVWRFNNNKAGKKEECLSIKELNITLVKRP
jgi:hypothetical protein